MSRLPSARQLRVALLALLGGTGCALAHERIASDAGYPRAIDARDPIDAALTLRDAAPPDATPSCVDSSESCNGEDDDCDSVIDESATCVLAGAISQCVDGECRFAECHAGRADCDGDETNGCETDVDADRLNCGACGLSCALRDTCRAGLCVRDPIRDVDPAWAGHACVVLESGRLLCWGNNIYDVLRAGDPTLLITEPIEIVGLPPIIDVEVGDRYTCALDANGVVWCWGLNDRGRLGQGHVMPVEGFASVALPQRAIAISATGGYTCAILDDQSLWCWGSTIESVGRVVSLPERISIPFDAGKIELASNIALALSTEGALSCWGYDWGACGFGHVERINDTPIPGAEIGPLIALSCAAHCCGVRADALGLCWGFDEGGQVGDGVPSSAAASPYVLASIGALTGVAVAGTITSGASCGWNSGGEAWCWGSGISGLNATGSSTPHGPRRVLVGRDVRRMWGNISGICASVDADQLVCWGLNHAGQLGDGSLERRGTPAGVRGFE